MNLIFIAWALALVISGLFIKRVRLVPFTVFIAVAFVHWFKFYESGHFLQQLSASFFILAAMIKSRSPQPQRWFIQGDIALNAILFISYLTDFPYYPLLKQIIIPVITALTGLILIAIARKSTQAYKNKSHKAKRAEWQAMDC